MDRMSPLDASFLHLEGPVSPMHIGSVAVFEGPAPPASELEAMVAGKLPVVPRYRQKVRFVPLDLGRPLWVDDPHFNIGYHVRHTALPPPGGDEELRNLVGRVMSQQLDRTKPLWEMWMVEGLEDGHWAIISKVHHAMVDGVSGTDLFTDAVRDRVVNPYEQFRALRSGLRGPRALRAQLGDVGKGLRSLVTAVRGSPETSLNGPIGPHRRWDWARSTLGDIKVVRTSLGGTVNDVVLTAITQGFRDLLLSRGETVDGRDVTTLVPVSVRTPGERGTYNNRVSAMFAQLPVGIVHPVERLTSIRVQMDGLKESKQAVAGEVLTSLTGFAPPMLLAVGTRVASRASQRNVNTVTTNVPGPQFPLYAVGRQMLEAFPFVPLGGQMRIGIAIFSYNGMINFGVTGDYDAAPDIGVLCRGIEDGMGELLKAAGVTGS